MKNEDIHQILKWELLNRKGTLISGEALSDIYLRGEGYKDSKSQCAMEVCMGKTAVAIHANRGQSREELKKFIEEWAKEDPEIVFYGYEGGYAIRICMGRTWPTEEVKIPAQDPVQPPDPEPEPKSEPPQKKTLGDVLNARTLAALVRHFGEGIEETALAYEVCNLSDEELLAIQGIGPRALKSLDEALTQIGFKRSLRGVKKPVPEALLAISSEVQRKAIEVDVKKCCSKYYDWTLAEGTLKMVAIVKKRYMKQAPSIEELMQESPLLSYKSGSSTEGVGAVYENPHGTTVMLQRLM